MAKSFGNLFVYEEQCTYGIGAHVYSRCHMLKPLIHDGVVLIDPLVEIEDALVDLDKGTIKFHVDDKIITTAYVVHALSPISIKSNKDNDSDFEYDKTDDSGSE